MGCSSAKQPWHQKFSLLPKNSSSYAFGHEDIRPGAPQFDAFGVARHAEFWGISRQQLSDLLSLLRDQPQWSRDTLMFDLVDKYVKDWTRGTGKGLALNLNSTKPLVVTKMISHAWQENVEEFLELVIKSSDPGDVFFICSFAIYQCEDGAGPSIDEQIGTQTDKTPFARVLEEINRRNSQNPWATFFAQAMRVLPQMLFLVSCVLLQFYPLVISKELMWIDSTSIAISAFHDDEGDGYVESCYHRARADLSWRVLLTGLSFLLLSAIGRLSVRFLPVHGMLVVPTRLVDIYTRLWCVYEVYFANVKFKIRIELARTLIPCGKCESAEATCSKSEDTDRLRKQIANNSGFQHVDVAVRRFTDWASARAAMGPTMSLGTILCGMSGRIVDSNRGSVYIVASCVLLVVAMSGTLRVIQLTQGTLSRSQAWQVALVWTVCCGLIKYLSNWNLWMYIVFSWLIYLDIRRQQRWAWNTMVTIAPISYVVLAILLHFRNILPEARGPCFQWQFLYLGFSIAPSCFAMCLLPRYLYYYDLSINPSPVDGPECRTINPAPKQRLVYAWQRRLFSAEPLCSHPVELPLYQAPPEMAARGIDDETWRFWMTRLIDANTRARRDPRFWLSTLFGYAAQLLQVLFGPAFTVVSLPIQVLVPCTIMCDPYQGHLYQWMQGFNQVLWTHGLWVKAQTIRKGSTETAYLSFALTVAESEALRREPCVAYGDSISHQSNTWDLAYLDRGRVI